MSKNKQNNFEEKLNYLETLVEELESGELSLDESLKKFEEGIKKYKECKGLLNEAEKKIKILSEDLKEEDYK